MTRKPAAYLVLFIMLIFVTVFEHYAAAADVEAVGDLKVDGIIFPDGNTQRSACTGCAGGVLSVDLGGTGANTATGARENLGVPGLITLNTFTASQTVQGDISIAGNLNLPATTASNGIIRSGANTLIHTYGSSNFFAGINAGNLSMSGYSNTASGYSALGSNTSGFRITAIGAQALSANTTGVDNTAVGAGALQRNTTGKFNTATGTYALYYAATSDDNTADGTYALLNNTTGYSNTATGTHALTANTTGFNNTAHGAYALQFSTGNYNTAMGAYALDANTNGLDNTATGSDALGTNTTGDFNTATGYLALGSNTSGYSNTASGMQALSGNTEGYNNTALGRLAGYTNTTGDYNTFVGYYADATSSNITNATAIGYNAKVDASNHIRIGNTSVTQIGGKVAWSNLSDMRVKKDIGKIAYGLEFIKALRPVQFRMKDGNDRTDFGFIAQDVEALLGDSYNVLGIGGDPDRTLSLRYTDFIAPMVKAIQEQQLTIDAQNQQIKSLEQRISRLEALMGDKKN